MGDGLQVHGRVVGAVCGVEKGGERRGSKTVPTWDDHASLCLDIVLFPWSLCELFVSQRNLVCPHVTTVVVLVIAVKTYQLKYQRNK